MVVAATAALPYFLAALRISGGLASAGAAVRSSSRGRVGSRLALRTGFEAGYRLQVPRMFAGLALLSLAGIAINAGLGAMARVLLRRRSWS